jgi:hypothetical protein
MAKYFAQDRLITRYLLGALSQAEQQHFEVKYFEDDDLFAKVEAVEQDLIDSYVRGELSIKEVKSFEARFLSTPTGRERVELARVLLEKMASQSEEAVIDGKKLFLWQKSMSWFSFQNPSLAWSVFIVFLMVGTFVTLNLRTELRQWDAERDRLLSQNKVLEQSNLDQQNQVSAFQQRLEEVGQELTRLKGALLPIKRFQLSSGVLRGENVKILRISKADHFAELQLNLDDKAEYTSYRATMMFNEGTELLRYNLLKAQTIVTGKIVLLQLPTAIFSNNQLFIIELEGFDASKSTFEKIGDYPFHVFF